MEHLEENRHIPAGEMLLLHDNHSLTTIILIKHLLIFAYLQIYLGTS